MSKLTPNGKLGDIDESLNELELQGGETISELENVTAKLTEIMDRLDQYTEGITHGVKVVNTDHSAIHYEMGYCVHLYLASLAPNAKKIYRFKGPTTLFAHIKSIQVNAQGSALSVKLIKNPTITNAGTEITGSINNLNDNSILTAQSKFYDGTVAYTGGTVWCQVVVNGASTSQSSSGGSFIQNENLEYVTKDGDTDYILELQNLDNSDTAIYINVNLFMYEEQNGSTQY